MLSDLRFAFRQLGKSPGFTFVAVLTLALGIGANTAIFSVINSALLRPLPYPESGQLVELRTRLPIGTHLPSITGPQFKRFREHAASFSEIAAFGQVAYNLIERGKAERTTGLEVSANYLSTLRCDVLHGQTFDPGADQIGGDNSVVILTHEWWHSRFGGDEAILGRTLTFGQKPYTVIGVLPPRALVDDDAQFLVPVVIDAAEWRLEPMRSWAGALGRLHAGVTTPQAQHEIRALDQELKAGFAPDQRFPSVLEVHPLQAALTETTRPTLIMLLGAVALVLLIACANVANLLLARARSRQKEMAVRSALGATRARIFRHVLTECLLLSLLGGVVGVLFAALAVDLLGRAVVGMLPNAMQPAIDVPVLVFSLLLACGTGVIFGLFPAFQAQRVDVNRDLKEAGRGSTSGGRTRAQSLLVIAEVAVTAVLLIASGLLLRSFARALAVDPGFDAKNVLLADFTLTEGSFKSVPEILQFQRLMVERLESLPGVVSTGISSGLPVSGDRRGAVLRFPDKPTDAQPFPGAASEYVAGNYFQTLRIRLLKGRLFSESDNAPGAAPVAIVNQQFAQEMMPGGNPIGQRMRAAGTVYEIVGVVANVRHRKLDGPPTRRFYVPNAVDPYTIRLAIRTRVAPLSVADEVRGTITALHGEQSIANVRTLEQAMGRALQERRVALALVGLFAAVALGLASLGIYGVVAYTIGQRERELSIRMALGAERSDVVRLVLRDGLRLGLIGIVVGLSGGLASAQLISSRLFEVQAHDPLVFGTVTVLISIMTLAAVILPARRATRFDALLALRAE